MNSWFLAGAAVAAAIATALPAAAAPVARPAAVAEAQGPAWIAGSKLSEGGRALIAVLKHSQLDGLASGPLLADRAEKLLANGQDDEANRLLSSAWVRYVQTIQQRAPGMEYADPSAAPRQQSPTEILSAAARTPSLAGHVAKVGAVNPVYAELRAAAIAAMDANGGRADPRVIDTLARLRHAAPQSRAIIVDAASANLWMIEDGRIAGTMKVITGDAANATPMIASTIHYATLNPYWNVPADLVRDTIAPRVVEQGLAYLAERKYEVFASYDVNAPQIDPATVDWAKVAAGEAKVRLRRAPDQWNSMGRMKFGFANDHDIFLHDTPNKELFAQANRNLSHGCIRLADAQALATWMLGRTPTIDSAAPEQQVLLPRPVPIYITYMTAEVRDGRLALRDDSVLPAAARGMRVASGR